MNKESIIKNGIVIDIHLYYQEESHQEVAASQYPNDDIIRFVTNSYERQKFKTFISNVEHMMMYDFDYDFKYKKYSNQYPKSVSKYYIASKNNDTDIPIRFPVALKLTDHYLTTSQEQEQEDYIIKKVNKLSKYKSKSNQKQNPDSVIRTINILDIECTTYPEAEIVLRNILSDIDTEIYGSLIEDYKSFVDDRFINGKSYQISQNNKIIETFDNVDKYILWLLDRELISRNPLNMNLDLLLFKIKYTDKLVYGEATHNDLTGIVIVNTR